MVDAERALLLAREGAEAVRALIDAGVPFDRAHDGTITLGREAAHSFARIVHAGGDFTGRNLINALLRMVAATPSVRVISECFVVDMVKQDGRVSGLLAYQAYEGWVRVHANHVVLATGGIGNLWRETTNPAEGTGDGLALAVRAGASLADLEFVQFHPTALLPAQHGDGSRLPLLTEALRGGRAAAGRIRPQVHARRAPASGVGAPRHRRPGYRAACRRGERVLLDLRPALAAKGEASFPQALTLCGQSGYDPRREPVPVAPAAHYHMGGVVTDAWSHERRRALACGEVAMTGVHGANRLASNSLLEGLVFGQRVAEDIRRAGSTTTPVADSRRSMPTARVLPIAEAEEIRRQLRALMATRGYRPIRRGLADGSRDVRGVAVAHRRARGQVDPRWARELLDDPALRRARNMLDVARLVILAALRGPKAAARTSARTALSRGRNGSVGWFSPWPISTEHHRRLNGRASPPPDPMPRNRDMPDVGPLYPLMYEQIVKRALEEDLGLAGDVTSDTVVPEDAFIRARLVARRPGRVAGLPVALSVFRLLCPQLAIVVDCADGATCPRTARLPRSRGRRDRSLRPSGRR